MTQFSAEPAYGPEGFPVPPSKNNRPGIPLTAADGQHQWACIATYTVSEAAAQEAAASWTNGLGTQGIHLDHENLVNIAGPGCVKCNQQMTPTTVVQRCPAQVIPLFRANVN